MPLRLSLKPHERVIAGGAVIRNGDHRAEFIVENQVPVLREGDILSPRDVRTSCQRVYMALQLLYVDADQAEIHRETLRTLLDEVRQAAPSCRPLLDEIGAQVTGGRLYHALKTGRALLERERELIEHAS